MNRDMQIWKIKQTVSLVFSDSLRVKLRSWLQWLPGNVSNVLETILGLEFTCNIDFSFQVFLEFLQIGYGVLAAFTCVQE